MPGMGKIRFFKFRMSSFLLFVRFNIVGIAATLSYFITGISISSSMLLPTAVHQIAFAISIVISYFGHALFTFNNFHFSSLIRFCTSSILLYFASYFLIKALVIFFHASSSISVSVITLVYPALSFVLHKYWSFSRH